MHVLPKPNLITMFTLLVIIVLLGVGWPHFVSDGFRTSPRPAITPTARPLSPRKRIALDGLSVDIPANWVTYLSREELAEVENPASEWDTEFGRACNAAIPFRHCVGHFGSEPWGEKSRYFNDLQVSVYLVSGKLTEWEKRFTERVRATVRPDAVERSTLAGWERILFQYHRTPFDYSATAVIDFRFKRIGSRIVVFVFMHTGFPGDFTVEIPAILDSLSVTEYGVE